MLCKATTKAGAPCKAHAVRGSELCSAHSRRNVGAGAPPNNSNATQHGFYSKFYTLAELADLVSFATHLDIAEEIGIARVALRRAFSNLDPSDPESYARLTDLVFKGTNSIARLLRIHHILIGRSADNIADSIATALNELSLEFDIEL